jgi:queuosine precursor transporter
MSWAVVSFPPAPGWTNQAAYETIYGQVPRIVLASLIAFWAGELANSYVLAKMKVSMEGRRLWVRTIGSTIVGEGVDSMIFYTVAFYGIWTTDQVLQVMGSNYLIKVGWEALATPVTYRVVGWLKRAEHEDYYDRETDFNPFLLKP